MKKNIFKKRELEMKRKLKKEKSIFKAFDIGIKTGKKIEKDLWNMNKKQLQQQLKLTKNQENKKLVKLVLSEKYKQDKKLRRVLK